MARMEFCLLKFVLVSLRLVLDLQIVSRHDEPDFSALSSTWGDPTNTMDIIVSGSEIPATLELANAIKDVQRHWNLTHSEQQILWADAIRINQNDNREKDHPPDTTHARDILGRRTSATLAWFGRRFIKSCLRYPTIGVYRDGLLGREG